MLTAVYFMLALGCWAGFVQGDEYEELRETKGLIIAQISVSLAAIFWPLGVGYRLGKGNRIL